MGLSVLLVKKRLTYKQTRQACLIRYCGPIYSSVFTTGHWISFKLLLRSGNPISSPELSFPSLTKRISTLTIMQLDYPHPPPPQKKKTFAQPLLLISPGYYRRPKGNRRQWLCKLLKGNQGTLWYM